MKINNENEEYIYLRKDLFNRWGLIKGLIIQYLINGDGEFIGSVGSFCNVVGIGSDGGFKSHLRELEDSGVIKKEKIRGWTNRFTLVNESYTKNKKTRHKLPKSVIDCVAKIEEIRNKRK